MGQHWSILPPRTMSASISEELELVEAAAAGIIVGSKGKVGVSDKWSLSPGQRQQGLRPLYPVSSTECSREGGNLMTEQTATSGTRTQCGSSDSHRAGIHTKENPRRWMIAAIAHNIEQS